MAVAKTHPSPTDFYQALNGFLSGPPERVSRLSDKEKGLLAFAARELSSEPSTSASGVPGVSAEQTYGKSPEAHLNDPLQLM